MFLRRSGDDWRLGLLFLRAEFHSLEFGGLAVSILWKDVDDGDETWRRNDFGQAV